ncbi:hypothetical protein CDG62_00260 (plasmid) [Acinetobacter sp. WCHA55]|uniref:hypothetical protein n=1 Tax=Acinetobacter sp. WCHA55 TaxID=2004646 RepID=UPI000B3D1813|nr:hypothetical protein [Acinetobacter sp. WCHA55]AYA66896.1 hypothetical protein CDG62_00260 [Acinetobacter sp. WCHA55]
MTIFDEELDMLLADRELTLSVMGLIPKQATDFRMNMGHPIFYRDEKYIGEAYRKPVERYIRYLDAFVPMLSLNRPWDDFKRENYVFGVGEFRQKASHSYPFEVIGVDAVKTILEARPEGSRYFNYLSGKYYRTGCNEFAEYSVFGGRMWLSSACLNENLADEFINLDELQSIVNVIDR